MSQSTQKEFFQLLSEFFERATGTTPAKFATLDTFDQTIKKNAEKLAPRTGKAFEWGINALLNFYSRNEMPMFSYAKQTGGLKLVLGGSSYFTPTHLDAVRKMLLYTDTILIPDPILPWIEVERKDAKFPIVLLLKSIFILLHLKPLVDANLTYPAIVVFPSFEKRLELNDEETKSRIANLLTNVFSYYLGYPFDSVESTLIYAREFDKTFLQEVEKNNLFIPPNGSKGMAINKAIEQYKKEIVTWRSEKLKNAYLSAKDSVLVWNGIYERIAPQFHLLENADELNSQPMLTIEAQWHYYRLCTNMFEGRLVKADILKPQTINTLRALTEQRFEWLGNIPIEVLTKLRENNENEEFRKKISTFVSELHESSVDDIDRVASEVGRGIASLLSENKKKVKEIEEKYKKLYEQTAIGAWITVGALFVPALAPFAAASPLAVTGKYVWDKIGEIRDKKQVSHSLMGVLATAKE